MGAIKKWLCAHGQHHMKHYHTVFAVKNRLAVTHRNRDVCSWCGYTENEYIYTKGIE